MGQRNDSHLLFELFTQLSYLTDRKPGNQCLRIWSDSRDTCYIICPKVIQKALRKIGFSNYFNFGAWFYQERVP